MKRMLVIASLLFACSKKAGDLPPASKTVEPAKVEPAKVEPAKPADDATVDGKMLDAMKRLAALFEANAKDCTKLAAEMQQFATVNHDLIAKANELDKHRPPSESQAFETLHKQEYEAIAAKMKPVMKTCERHVAFEAAFQAVTQSPSPRFEPPAKPGSAGDDPPPPPPE